MLAASGSRVAVLAESDDFDAVLYVVDEDSVLYSDDDGAGTNSFLEFEMPHSGQVDILAGSYWPNAEGEYRLRVGSRASLLLDEAGDYLDPLDLTDSADATVERSLVYDSVFVDPIRGHRLQRWIVLPASGSRVDVQVESDDFDAVLYVVYGDSVLYSDNDGSGTNSFLEFEMPHSGPVSVLAGSRWRDAEGEYRMTVKRQSE